MIDQRTIVRRISSGAKGVTCPDLPGPLSCNGPDEITVVYHGTTYGSGTPEGDLEIIGPENAAPDPKQCGAGHGADCCIFLTVGPNGFECERHSALRWALVFKTMTAKRHPAIPFPGCMTYGTSEVEDKANDQV